MFSQEQWGQLLADFLEEARDLIQQAEAALLELDDGTEDPEVINRLFRAVHTLKGSAGLFALEDFVAFTHQQESLIMRVRDSGQPLSNQQISALLKGLDILRTEVDSLASGAEATPLLAVHPEQFALLQSFFPEAQVPVAATPDIARQPGDAGDPAASWHISLRFSRELFQFGFDPASFMRYLAKLGEITHMHFIHNAIPQWQEYQPELCFIGLEVDLQSEATKQEIEDVFEFIRDLAKIRILPPQSKTGDYLQLIAELPEGNELLGEILVESGLLTRRELEEGLSLQASKSEPTKLGKLLVDEGIVPQVAVDKALQKQEQIRERRQ